MSKNKQVIQSVRFDKNKIKLEEAKRYLREELKLTPSKPVDITANQYRFRIINPILFNLKSFKTVFDKNKSGVQFIIGKLTDIKKKQKLFETFNESETDRPITKIKKTKQFTHVPIRKRKRKKQPVILV